MPGLYDPEQDEPSRRIKALRNLAQRGDEQASAPVAVPSRTRRRMRKPLIAAVMSALILIALAGGLIARAITSPNAPVQTQKASATLNINPGEDDFACPRDIAWSPNNKTVALLGYQGNCATPFPSMYSYHPGIITFYDVTKGKVTETLQLDPIIAAALGLKPPTIATPMTGAAPTDRNTSQQAIDYEHLLWSPDGKQLAVTFSVEVATGQSSHGFDITRTSGVLLSSLTGTQTRVLSHTLARNEWYSGLWNLATGTYKSFTTPNATNADVWLAALALMPPALRYQWGNDGRLEPSTLLNAKSAPIAQPSAPVGQPDGGKYFSIWQPGVAQLITQDNKQPSQPLKTPVETWQSSFAAWSADGKYFLADSTIQSWRVALSGQAAPDNASLSTLGLENAPVLPIRDAGLAAVLKSYHDVSVNPAAANTLVNLAWSPDGKRLAVEAPIPPANGQKTLQLKDYAVHVYDCVSGKLLTTLVPNLRLNGIQAATFLRWSPDGSRLLLYDTSLSGAQIWGPQELPK